MKHFALLSFLFISLFSEAQISLSYLDHWQITPESQDSNGVFCRTFYHPGRNKYYVVFAGRPTTSGPMSNYRWREYDAGMNFTGSSGILAGQTSAGDFAMVMVGTYYYHVAATSPWSFKLSKYDDNFVLVSSVNIPLDTSDSQADMMLNYTNGRLVLGAFRQQGFTHPSMPQQQTSWTPKMHKWEYDLNLNPLNTPAYLSKIFNTWGSSCIYNNNLYNIITMYKWPNYLLSVYRYDNNWNYIDSVPLNNDGQWSQGVIWDGTYYYVGYHSGHEHRSGNITVAIYDVNWSLVYDTVITNNAVFIFNSSPPLNTTEYNANRPFLTKVADTLFVSYDEDDYKLTSYNFPHFYQESQHWHAHVTKLQINGSVNGVKEEENGSGPVIYPNPSANWFHFNTKGKGMIRIFNTLGETVFSTAYYGETDLDAGNWAPGIYFYSVTGTNGNYTGRLMRE